jgi:photosystem II stability/assembly factor-like uncharacterized protein
MATDYFPTFSVSGDPKETFMLFTSKRTIRLSIFILLIIGLVSHLLASRAATGSFANHPSRSVNLPTFTAAHSSIHSNIVSDKHKQQVSEIPSHLPLSFEQNAGQVDEQLKFFCRNKAYNIGFTTRQTTINFTSSSKDNNAQQSATLKMKFINSNPASNLTGVEKLETKSNYFRGNNPKDWHTNVANFASLKYENLYNGIDAIFYGNQQNVEYDFVVAPQADAKLIQLSFEGAQGIRIDQQGDLILQTSAGEMRQHKPFAYQEVEGQRKEVICKYKLLQTATSSDSAKVKKHNQKVAGQLSVVGFTIGEYDKTLPIIIDPVLDFSTCLGGESGSGLGFNATDVVVDADENIYIVGYASYLPQFSSASKGVQTQAALNQPGIFVAKIDSINKKIVYYTTLTGTSPYDSFRGTGIAVDDAGNAYVTGSTTSPSFPTTQDAFQTGLRGNTNGFITKLSPEGNTFVYSTFLGAADNLNTGNVSQCTPQQFGNCITTANDIAIDAAGNAFVTGETSARNFPTTPNAFKPVKSDNDSASAINSNGSPYTEAFVTKLNATGTSLIYSTFLGGNGNDSGNGITLDASGNVYVVGTTAATDFPMQNALYGSYLGGTSDAFLSKLNPTGTTLLYSTYLGGISRDTGKAIDIDAAENVYLCGDTNSTNLPVTAGAFQSKPGNAHFYKSTNSGATWKPLLNGFDGDRGEIAIDPDNSANLFAGTSSGISQSTDGGESWQAPSNRQVNPFSYVTFAPQNPAVAFAMAYQANRGYILLRTTDKGSTWNEIAYPTPEGTSSRNFDLQVDPTNLSTLYLSYTFYSLTGTYHSRILKTTDTGVTWKYINEGFPSQTDPYLSGINPQNPALLFAKADGLYRSKDGGNKWKPTDLVDGGISHISFNPANPSIVYATGDKLYGSTDSGMTWKQIENNLTDRFPNYNKLLVTTDNLYTLFTGQAFKSMDGGRVWANISPTSGLTNIRTLAVDPKNPATLYAGTQRFDEDGFVMKINVQASALTYCTYLSGESYEITSNIAVDDFGNAIVIGSTDSLTFPTHNAFQAKPNYLTDAFVTKLNSTGGVIYSTYFGGNYDDMGGGVATDKSGRVYIVGTTTSNQFPKIAPLQPSVGNGASFIARITDLPAVYSPPAVFSVTPNSGAGAGQTRITIKGANFLQGATVSVGGTLSQETVVVDANTIQAIAQGAFSGQANIVVMNPDGQTGALEKAFNFLLTPLLLQVTVENNQLVLSGIVASPTGSGGYGFDSGAVLLVNGKEIKIDPPITRETLRSKKALKKIQPGQIGQLQVRNGNGLRSNIFSFRRP